MQPALYCTASASFHSESQSAHVPGMGSSPKIELQIDLSNMFTAVCAGSVHQSRVWQGWELGLKAHEFMNSDRKT